MTSATETISSAHSRRLARSSAAVFTGFISVVVLSLATDQALHVFAVYPPWGEPMWNPWLNLLALSYRTVYAIVAGYITATLAPHAPMHHVRVVGGIGFVAATAGAIATIAFADFGPDWYPIALALTSYHAVWIGGVLYRVRRAGGWAARHARAVTGSAI